MAKICQIELISSFGSKLYDLAHGVHECRLAVGRESHDFVFVAVVGETQILRERLVEDPERVWEIHAAIDGDDATAADPPCRAGEVAEAVDRDHHGLSEGRNME